MPINLRKYDGKYIEVLYGSETLRGRLVGTMLYEIRLDGIDRIYELNEQQIAAIRDITKEVYESLKMDEKRLADSEKEWAESKKEWRNAGQEWTDQQHSDYRNIVDKLADIRKKIREIEKLDK